VTEETNGNRWKDYDSEDVSDEESPQQRAVRKYPRFDTARKNADCLGYTDNLGGSTRRNVFLTNGLFSEMKAKEEASVKKTGWAGRNLAKGAARGEMTGSPGDRKPAAKRLRSGVAKKMDISPGAVPPGNRGARVQEVQDDDDSEGGHFTEDDTEDGKPEASKK
jgi:hypothetical protein